jgi:hypothetical protein
MHHIALRPGRLALVKPVHPLYARYFREEVLPRFQPISLDQFVAGPIGISTTAARFSYVLDNEAVNWCIEWNPGLLVINVTPNSMQWAARRSPNPEFGGRSATAAERERYAEWEQSWEKKHHLVQPPQYGLIFDAWDDIVEQSFSGWQPASDLQSQTIRKVFDRLDGLAERLPKDTSTYGECVEEWRRSDFWRMRWEDFD